MKNAKRRLSVNDTGMRCGEMIALRWRDVDWENGLLTIEKSASMTKNRDKMDDEDNNFVYLVVGTQKRDDYKIYMYDLEAGMPKNLVKSFGGQGKVKMCVYMSSAVYSGIIRKQNNSLPN